MVIDVLERDDLPFPRSLPEFQRLFPDEAPAAGRTPAAACRRAPAPAPIVRKLNDAFQAVLKQPEVIAKLADLGALSAGGPSSDLTALLKVELPRWRVTTRFPRT